MKFEEFKKNLEYIESKYLELSVIQNQYNININNISSEITKLEDNHETLEKVSNLFKHLLDTLLDQKKKDIEQLVTYGLKSVIDDQDLKFHIDIEPKYNNIYTTFRTEHVGVMDGDVLDNFGGGIVNIQSFLLRIITLFQSKLHPFLVLDESFSNLSEEYVENCSKLLKSLCDQLGLTILLVTHQPLMLQHADRVYKAYRKDDQLFVDEVKND